MEVVHYIQILNPESEDVHQVTFCGSCGNEVDEDATYCASCGSSVGPDTRPPIAAPMPLTGPVAQKTNSKAIWALVLGILSIVMLGVLTAIPAILLGSMAKKEIAISGEQGQGMANAGFIIGIVVTVLSVFALVAIFAIIATSGI